MRARAVAPVVALAASVLLAGCTAPEVPRESARPDSVPASLMRFVSDDCLERAGTPTSGGGWSVSYTPQVSVQLARPDGSRDTSPDAIAWEAAMEACLGAVPVLWENEPWSWSEFEIRLQYLYYTGPLTACLRDHGIEPEPAFDLEQYRAGGYPLNPYWAMDGELDHLLDVYRDCPPYADLPLEHR